MFEAPCPKCGNRFAVAEDQAPRRIRCPNCRKQFTPRKTPQPSAGAWEIVIFWSGLLLTTLGLVFLISKGIGPALFWLVSGTIVVVSILKQPLIQRVINRWDRRRRERNGQAVEQPLVPVSEFQITTTRPGSIPVARSPSSEAKVDPSDAGPLRLRGVLDLSPTATQRITPAVTQARDDRVLVEIAPETNTAGNDNDSATRSEELNDPARGQRKHRPGSPVIASVPLPARRSNQVIVEPPLPTTPESLAKSLTDPVTRRNLEFIGPGMQLTFDRGTLRSSLVYLSSVRQAQEVDPSVIELPLPVARSGILPAVPPGNMPSYRTFDAAQRSYYLDWLIEGRRRSDISMSYLKLYCYGLERRALVDGLDQAAIVEELLALIQVHASNSNFLRDAVPLLSIILVVGVHLDPELIRRAILIAIQWLPSSFRASLDACANQKLPLDSDLALELMKAHPEATVGVILKRHPELFRQIWTERFDREFPQGYLPEVAGREESIEYLAINPTIASLPRSATQMAARKRVRIFADHFPLLAMWEQSQTDLKTYDRAHKASDGQGMTAEMWEALPAVSRESINHPEAVTWSKLIAEATARFQFPLVRMGDLALVKNFEERVRLSKKQSEQILVTASHLGLALEPDSRMTGKSYGWDEMVAVFPCETLTQEDWPRFHAAATFLRLGMHIANADGRIDEAELNRITEQLQQQFNLPGASAARLRHLRCLLVQAPESIGKVEKSLREKLNAVERQTVGQFLISIATCDGECSAQEEKALKSVWQALGLEIETLRELLAAEAKAAAPPGDLVLDQERIARIMRDTHLVAQVLQQAMAEDDETSTDETSGVPLLVRPTSEESRADETIVNVVSEVPPVEALTARESAQRTSTANLVTATANAARESVESQMTVVDDERWCDLPRRYHAFLHLLTTKTVWSRKELDQQARQHSLILGGALEAINEWMYDKQGDWLTTEDGAEIHVQTSLI